MGSRDFRGYAGSPPRVRWPDDARVAVSLVLNVEEGAELSISAGDERNESMHEFVHELEGVRDLCMESHFEYGSRAGYWRIVELLSAHGLPCTVNACVRALETTPWICEDIQQRQYEVMCHGYRWEPHAFMGREPEQEVIIRCTRELEHLTGQRPLGWHCKSYASEHTRSLLAGQGYQYDSNVYNDDLPYVERVNGRDMVCLPYSFDTNDMRFQNNGGFTLASDFAQYCIDAFDCLWREGARTPRMMTVALHTRVIGRPARIAGLQQFLEHIQEKGDAWVATRQQIAQHWLDAIN